MSSNGASRGSASGSGSRAGGGNAAAGPAVRNRPARGANGRFVRARQTATARTVAAADDGSASGKVTAKVEEQETTVPVRPAGDTARPDGDTARPGKRLRAIRNGPEAGRRGGRPGRGGRCATGDERYGTDTGRQGHNQVPERIKPGGFAAVRGKVQIGTRPPPPCPPGSGMPTWRPASQVLRRRSAWMAAHRRGDGHKIHPDPALTARRRCHRCQPT